MFTRDDEHHVTMHDPSISLVILADHERIRTISFDNKSKTITIVGPFDPQRLACNLHCKGGKVIKDVHIVDTNGGGGKPPPQNMPDRPTAPAPAPVRIVFSIVGVESVVCLQPNKT